MTVPFTYIITHIPSNVKYYGVRYAKNCHPSDLGATYFSSSKIVKELMSKESKDNFLFEVRKIFSSKEKAVEWEYKFLTRIDAARSSLWFNRYNGNRKFLILPGHRLGYKHTEQTKQRMRKPKSPEHKQKLHEHLDKVRTVPEWTDKRKEQRSKMMSGEANHNYGRPDHPGAINFVNIAKARKGKTFEELYGDRANELKVKCSKSASSPKKTINCPHCGKIGAVHLMPRYHFDNCKMRLCTTLV